MLKNYKLFFARLSNRDRVADLAASTVSGALFFILGWYGYDCIKSFLLWVVSWA